MQPFNFSQARTDKLAIEAYNKKNNGLQQSKISKAYDKIFDSGPSISAQLIKPAHPPARSCAHMHAQTHIHKHALAHALGRRHPRIHTQARPRTIPHMNMNALAYRHTHTCTHTSVPMHTHANEYEHTCTHLHTCTHVHTQARTDTYAYMRNIYAHARTLSRMRARVHTHSYTHTHAHAHAYTRTRACTRIHTHMHATVKRTIILLVVGLSSPMTSRNTQSLKRSASCKYVEANFLHGLQCEDLASRITSLPMSLLYVFKKVCNSSGERTTDVFPG